MQKIVNVVAIASGVVSLAVVGSGLFVFVNRDKLVDNVKSQVMEAVVGALPLSIDSALPDLTGPAQAPAAAPAAGLELPQ
tara:strand:+ start:194 stop:433 length:240 start_codon:yes stop_codon:yes gene_type:complete